MPPKQINNKIRQNLKELQMIMQMIENNQSKEKIRYLINLSRIYLYETTLLLSSDRVSKNLKNKATSDITQFSTILNPISLINQKNSLRIN